jgi:hypothetical protein
LEGEQRGRQHGDGCEPSHLPTEGSVVAGENGQRHTGGCCRRGDAAVNGHWAPLNTHETRWRRALR